MAGVRRLRPCVVRAYQYLEAQYKHDVQLHVTKFLYYCSSHHAGEMRSVTDKGFLGAVRKRSRGLRESVWSLLESS